MSTLEQLRAKNALDAVRQAKRSLDDRKQAEFKREARKLPVRVMTSGIDVSLAFLKEKDKAPDLYLALNGWLNQRLGGAPKDILDRVVEGSASTRQRTTLEALAWLQWVKRFVEIEGFADSEED
jgi:CRISPR-associated protein Cmr5